MKYLILATVLLLVGCERHYSYGGKCNGCQDMKRPEDYMATFIFNNYEDKEIRFSTEVDADESGPDAVYQVRGIAAGKEEFYYSQFEPAKQDTGLLCLEELNGANVKVDFTSVEIRMLPCTRLPLDEVSQKRIEYAQQYKKIHRECPRHGSNPVKF